MFEHPVFVNSPLLQMAKKNSYLSQVAVAFLWYAKTGDETA
ncbi:hypothetical protein FHW36_102404 [Chitinophaga polysaccharea]|uniref:Uncharacterized protein n=1 Tax=Chitinophaga polysaccharea TaxID=1293035 RepID=A0A561PWZ4_9BACT|nr:hypothetical protein FHW36_102404 [Chitinophaga polysaccharea]